MNKRFLILLGLIAIFAISGYADQAGANTDFGEIDSVVKDFDTYAQNTIGFAGRTIIGWLPLVLFLTGIVLGIKHAKRQSDQDQDNTKVFITAAIAGVVGAFVGILIDASIGAMLMGNSGQGIRVLTDYWGNIFFPGQNQ